jgi:hypothetical protein
MTELFTTGSKVEVIKGFSVGSKGVIQFVEPLGPPTGKIWVLREHSTTPVYYHHDELKLDGQDAIRNRVHQLKEEAMSAEREIFEIQTNGCLHPNVVTTNRGYEDDFGRMQYWKEYFCPDCYKYWKDERY